jgi:hypothetical protein
MRALSFLNYARCFPTIIYKNKILNSGTVVTKDVEFVREFFYKDCSPERLVWVGYRLWKTKVLEIFSLLLFLLLPLPSMAYVEVQDRYFLHEVSEASDEILDNLAILDLSEKMLKVAIKEGDYEKADLLEKYIEISMKNIRELMKK